MKYLHEVIKGQDWFHDNWNNRFEYDYIWTIDNKWIKDNNLIPELPVKSIKNIQPFKNRYSSWGNETLVVTFHEPYEVYNCDMVRIKSSELIKIINRKKKSQVLRLNKKRRYFHLELKGE